MTPLSRCRQQALASRCLLIALALGGGSLTAQDESIVGKWESVARNQGGLGLTFEFHPDGSIGITPGAMVDFTYRLDGDRLVMSFIEPGTGEVSEHAVAVRFKGDSMTQADPESGEKVRYSRLGEAEADAPPIVGAWSFKHYTGGKALQVYTADGHGHLRVPLRTDRGTYTLAGDTLRIVTRKRTVEMHCVIDGTTLTLRSPEGPPEQYRRITW